MMKMFIKYQPDANLDIYEGKRILHQIAGKYSNPKYQSEKAKMKDVMTLLVLLFDADLTLTDKRGKKPLDYLNDPKLQKYLEEDVAKLKDNINKTCGTSATDFILHYFEQNPDKSIEDCVKDLSNNFDQLIDKHACNTDSPSASFNTTRVEKGDKNRTIM